MLVEDTHSLAWRQERSRTSRVSSLGVKFRQFPSTPASQWFTEPTEGLHRSGQTQPGESNTWSLSLRDYTQGMALVSVVGALHAAHLVGVPKALRGWSSRPTGWIVTAKTSWLMWTCIHPKKIYSLSLSLPSSFSLLLLLSLSHTHTHTTTHTHIFYKLNWNPNLK